MYAVDIGCDDQHHARMAKEPVSERIIIPMAESLVKAIDDYRFTARRPSRADAIRHLIELGLEAAKREKPEKKR